MRKILFSLLGLIAFTTVMAQSKIERETHVYAIKGKDTLHLDIYLDPSVPVKTLRPVMIHIHGGGFSAGSRKNVAQEMFNRHYAEQGFVSVSIDYRLMLAPENLKPDGKYTIKDVSNAVRIANEDLISATNFILGKATELKADPATVLISGGSAGAIVCLTIENDICNQVDYTKALPKGFNYAGIISHAGSIQLPEGGKELVWAKKPCPMLLFHGDQDFAVPFERGTMLDLPSVGTKYLIEQFTKMDIPHWAFVEKGADHVIAMKALTDNFEESDTFFRKFIMEKSQSIVYTEWADEEPADMRGVDRMVKFVPLYILGFGKYLEEMENSPIEKPANIVF